MNALQELINSHCQATGDSLADIAARGGMSRQTLSGLVHRDRPGAIPQRPTLARLALGLGVSLEVVELAAAMSASAGRRKGDIADLRLALLMDQARELDDQALRVLVATARALRS